MAIDDVRLPENWSRGSSGGPAFLTSVTPLADGSTDREERWEDPLGRWEIAHNIKTPADMAALRAFHMARRGASRAFLLKDWLEYTSAADGVSAASALDQPLGTGDGAETVFSLVKRYSDAGGSYDQPIKWPVAGTVLVAVDGTPLGSGFTVQRGAGTVTFAAAPALAAALTVGFQFDVPVRFVDDQLAVTFDTINSRSAGSVQLEEDRS